MSNKLSKCLNCGKEIKTPTAPSSIAKGAGKYCSAKCRYEYQKKTSGSTRNCIVCGKQFYAKGNPSGRKICSNECRSEYRKDGRMVSCDNCGKTIYRSKQRLMNSDNSFCTIECANKYQGRNKIIHICPICGQEFRSSASLSPLYCSVKCRIADVDHLKLISSIGNLAQYHKRGLNKLEKCGSDILREIGIEFNEQVSISGKFVVDIVIAKHKLVIQWDGIYWHSKPERMNLDNSQDAYLRECGYTILRFTDKQVYSEREMVYDTIKRAIQ